MEKLLENLVGRKILEWLLHRGRPASSADPSAITGSQAETTEVALGDSSLQTTNTALQSAPSWIFSLLAEKDFLLLTAQVIFSAMGIIWLGAHGALRRPPSAAPRKGKSKKEAKEDHFTEGLVASDAIMFPLLAGTVLVGLYYLIKWLQDPDILNKILRAYMSLLSLASLGKLLADSLHFATRVVFPNVWRDRSGRVFEIDPTHRCQWLLEQPSDADSVRVRADGQTTPFPGFLSRASSSGRFHATAWEARHLLTEEWTFRLAMHGLVDGKVTLKLNDLLGYLLGLLVTFVYYITNSPALSNLMGTAFCYTAFIMMSPTSFGIGTLVLWGLFVYDIVMVFYTPYMITVATKLDVPIKLMFNGPSRSSMLGLGDIVIPGIFISLALRFDLWRYYQKQIKYVPVELETEISSETLERTKTTTETHHTQVKAQYVDVQGRWGDRLWTTSWTRPFSNASPIGLLAATAFPKTYFYASMAGYAVGMLLTLTMLLVFSHGQPALLYLVPGVTGATWLTGLWRGEISDMWTYTEDGTLDTHDVIVELDGSGKVVKEITKDDEPKTELASKGESPGQSGYVENRTGADLTKASEEASLGTGASPLSSERRHRQDRGYDVFVFSISAPRPSGLSED